MHPKISIVTVSYNSAAFIERTILSVLSQNYPNLEYIVIDGGSTDGSAEVIRKYEDRLVFWCSEKDKGQYDAINKGFAKSTGEIMAFLNADDVYLPWTLHTMSSVFSILKEVEWLTSLNPSMIDETGSIFRSGNIRPISTKGFRQGFYIPGKSDFGCIVQEGTFWRRSLWEKAGSSIDLKYKLAADFDLWGKFTDHSNLYCLAQPLAAMTRHSGQRSNNMSSYQSECIESLKALHKRKDPSADWNPDVRITSVRRSRLLWAATRRMIDYTALVVDGIFDETTYKTKWVAKQIPLY
ncbi:MAG TPA: glycosyltransferase family 2 protein [Cyclobacteriaceae bacterium]|nr:glycosyltransferase family 2 protein [Cyclobacteriaceae bacterium]